MTLLLSIKKNILQDFLKESSTLIKYRANEKELKSLVNNYVKHVKRDNNPFFDTDLSSIILLEQAKSNYFKGASYYTIKFSLNKKDYVVNCDEYGTECNYIINL